MKKEQITMKKRVWIAVIGIIVTGGLIALFVFLYANSIKNSEGKIANTKVTQVDNSSATTSDPIIKVSDMMPVTLFIQDKEAAKTVDCGVTKPTVYQTPKTSAVADASLKILFRNELKQYGTYQSVAIANGVATVMLASDTTSSGAKISSLSSCEATHLMSVLTDTLTQYPTVQSVELMSPQGKIQF